MKFDKETIIVILIAVGVLLAWGYFYPQWQKSELAEQNRIQAEQDAFNARRNEAEKAKSTVSSEASAVPKTEEVKSVQSVTAAHADGSIRKYDPVVLSNNLTEVTLDLNSGAIISAKLDGYKTSDKTSNIVLGKDSPEMTFSVSGLDGWTLISTNSSKQSETSAFIEQEYGSKSGRMVMVRKITLSNDSYIITEEMTLRNLSQNPIVLPKLEIWSGGIPDLNNLAGDKLFNDPHNIEYVPVESKKLVSVSPAEKTDEKFNKHQATSPVAWVGTVNKYFALLLLPSKPFDGGVTYKRVQFADKANTPYYVPAVAGVYSNVAIPAGGQSDFKFTFYSGPKEMSRIKQLPDESVVGVMHLSYFSFMDFLARPLVWLLNYLEAFAGSYGIAIILLTLIVRTIFWPITQKANDSMRKMQKLQPKMQALREKYKDKPQEVNSKMMELYKTEKINPLGGCLPILLQLPVFFALYSALDSAVELRQVSFLWATDLTKPDLVGPQFLFGYGIHPLILMMTALMALQQKMTPSTMDPIQQKMMMMMPVIMLVMLYNLPSGLTLYWTVSQVFSIIQLKYSLYIAKREEEKENSLKSKTA